MSLQQILSRRLARAEDALRNTAASIESQNDWMNSCGGNLAGYVRRYGSANHPSHYGDGGEAIYAADKAELVRLFEVFQDQQERHAKIVAEVRDHAAKQEPKPMFEVVAIFVLDVE